MITTLSHDCDIKHTCYMYYVIEIFFCNTQTLIMTNIGVRKCTCICIYLLIGMFKMLQYMHHHFAGR